MYSGRFCFIFLALVFCVAPAGMAAPACSVREKAPKTAHTFAKAGDQDTWREYTTAGLIPELKLDSGMSAQFWQHKDKGQSVYTVQPGQDFTIYTRYCFSGEGALEQVDFEVRTPLGWGHRIEGSMAGNDFNASAAGFFNLENGKEIPKPRGVGEAPAALKPTIYLKSSDLPFASLLPVPGSPGKGKKPAPTYATAFR